MGTYCSNEYCKGRDECKKAEPMQDGDKVEYFINGYYANRCKEFEPKESLEIRHGLRINKNSHTAN
jgi:hypothetical protein